MTLGLSLEAGTQRRISEKQVAGILVGILCAILVLIIALPLWALLSKSFEDSHGAFVGLSNYVTYFTTPTLSASLVNSLLVAFLSTAIVVPLAFTYAYALTRTRMRGRGLFYAAALLPIFAPSLLAAISLVYIFGNQGFLSFLLMGNSVYGPIGIVMGEVLSTFPHALLILVTALSLADGRLYEAASALGTPKWRVFWTVTLPGAKFGVINATFVVFTLVITDFGVPKVIGGQFSVLATDAYRQVVGQQNFSMGAVVGMILLVPAAVAFLVDRIAKRRQVALLSARAVPYEPAIRPVRRHVLLAVLSRGRGPHRRDLRGRRVGVVHPVLALQSVADAQQLRVLERGTGRLGSLFQLAQNGGFGLGARNSPCLLRRLSAREDGGVSAGPRSRAISRHAADGGAGSRARPRLRLLL